MQGRGTAADQPSLLPLLSALDLFDVSSSKSMSIDCLFPTPKVKVHVPKLNRSLRGPLN